MRLIDDRVIHRRDCSAPPFNVGVVANVEDVGGGLCKGILQWGGAGQRLVFLFSGGNYLRPFDATAYALQCRRSRRSDAARCGRRAGLKRRGWPRRAPTFSCDVGVLDISNATMSRNPIRPRPTKPPPPPFPYPGPKEKKKRREEL